MPTLRERRPVRRPTYFVVEEKLRKRWTLVEKKKALTGLRRYGNRNIEAICAKYLPHKTVHEINSFFTQMKNRARLRPHIPKVKVPIELWTDMAEQLTSGVEDYSTTLGNVMQKIGTYECHDDKINREDPDWFLIYSYFTALLKADELPQLGQIEAGVVLDLLDSMSRHLTDLEVSSQRRLAEMKYKLLSTRVDPNDKKRIHELSSQALDSDLLQTNGSSTAAVNTSSGGSQPATSSTVLTPSTSSHTADGGDSGSPGTEAGNDGERPETYLVKPLLAPLYSINPLCIPVKYLGLRQQTLPDRN